MPHLVFVGEGRQVHIAPATRIQIDFLGHTVQHCSRWAADFFLPFVLISGVANKVKIHPDPVPALEPETTPTV